MNNFTKFLKYIIFILGSIIIIGALLSGCDNLQCYPEFDINNQYIGIKCDSRF